MGTRTCGGCYVDAVSSRGMDFHGNTAPVMGGARHVGRARPVERLNDEVFTAGDRLCITNSEPDLVANVGICLAHYFRRQEFDLNQQA